MPFLNFLLVFTAQRSYASAVLGVVILSVRPSVCLSVRLSHACFVTNQRTYRQYFIPYQMAIILFLWRQRSWRNSNEVAPKGCQIEVGYVKTAIFDQYLAISHKRCKLGTQLPWNANKNS